MSDMIDILLDGETDQQPMQRATGKCFLRFIEYKETEGKECAMHYPG